MVVETQLVTIKYVCKFTCNCTTIQLPTFLIMPGGFASTLPQFSSKNPMPESMSSMARSSISKLTAVIPCCLQHRGRAESQPMSWLTCKSMNLFGGITM